MASNYVSINDDGLKRRAKIVYKRSYHNGSDEMKEECATSQQSDDTSVFERFGKQEIFQRPLCLVFTDDNMNLQIDESVSHQISRIDVPISVVGVSGVYRTGKSYLMNRLAGKRRGFPVGSTTQSKTKGIWVWCQPHPKVKDNVLVLLDTEGLCDADKNNHDHDVKIFCLTMLMSSCLVYNMKGVIDKDALDRLSYPLSPPGLRICHDEDGRRRLKSKVKGAKQEGNRNAKARGASPVRFETARRNETKLLPAFRHVLDMDGMT